MNTEILGILFIFFATVALAIPFGKYIAKVFAGERTLLDNSMILYCSSMMTGGHDNNQLPVVLVGRGGGQIRTGRVLDYLNRPNRKMCSLYLSLMDKAGVRLDRFGDSNQRLEEI